MKRRNGKRRPQNSEITTDLEIEITETPEAVRLYLLTDVDGSTPFEKWFYGLHDRGAQARILTRLLRVELGNLGDHRERIAGAISELRLDYGSGYRLYFVKRGELVFVLLGGGTKDTQQEDIRAAFTLWERNKDNAERFSREFRPRPE